MTLNRPVIIVLGLPRHLYRHGWGWLLGHRFLQLTHVGRRTGQVHTTVLEVAGSDQKSGEVMVVSGFGPGSDWLRNIRANGRAEISIGRESFPASFRMAPVEEATEILADYERRNRLAAPLIRLVLSRLLGWRYDGTPQARRRAAEALPVVAFSRCRT
ncbi:MAG: nitroreductase family deazaflavin-dependent oxidoreductase [Dermatophilaceae bacterium]